PHRDLRDTRSANRGAYEPAVAIRREYHTWLQQQELKSAQDVGAQYDRIRLRLLTTIIDSTPSGYRAADARFLAAEILFNQKRVLKALSCWNESYPHPQDSYIDAYSRVLRELKSSHGASVREIDRILRAEQGRWLMFSFERLRQFGYAFDTF